MTLVAGPLETIFRVLMDESLKNDAFKAQNGQTVPLVWMHNHADPENVLGFGPISKIEMKAFMHSVNLMIQNQERPHVSL